MPRPFEHWSKNIQSRHPKKLSNMGISDSTGIWRERESYVSASRPSICTHSYWCARLAGLRPQTARGSSWGKGSRAFGILVEGEMRRTGGCTSVMWIRQKGEMWVWGGGLGKGAGTHWLEDPAKSKERVGCLPITPLSADSWFVWGKEATHT